MKAKSITESSSSSKEKNDYDLKSSFPKTKKLEWIKNKLLSYWEIPQSRGYIKLDSYVNNEVAEEEIASSK